MFETKDFADQIESVIKDEAGRRRLPYYQTPIISYLQKLASDNESVLMEREFRKAASQQRGLPDALASARELAKEASQYAVSEGRNTLELSDIQRAYQAKFCQVWPFCR